MALTTSRHRGLVCAILPMKRFSEAKSRLRPSLSDAARAELAREMFQRTLAAALGCAPIDRTYVVTNGDDVAALAAAAGAKVLRDPSPSIALGELMDWALREVTARSATRAVILMSDVPSAHANDVEELCQLLDNNDCVLVPDRHGCSTNALGLRLPFLAQTAFGRSDSYAEHQSRARALGLRAAAVRNPRLALDVDVVGDLAYVESTAGTLTPAAARVAAKHQGW